MQRINLNDNRQLYVGTLGERVPFVRRCQIGLVRTAIVIQFHSLEGATITTR